MQQQTGLSRRNLTKPEGAQLEPRRGGIIAMVRQKIIQAPSGAASRYRS